MRRITSAVTEAAASGRLFWMLALSIVLMFALAYILYQPTRINADAALCLQEGDLVLDGGVPYVDIIELNPPLIIYLSALTAATAHVLHLPLILSFLLEVWLLSVASTIVVRSVLRRVLPEDEWWNADVLAMTVALYSAALLMKNFYGQREHLFVLGLFPYLAMRFRHWEGGRASTPACIAIGITAGLATCFKPHFVPIALAPEVYWLLVKRSWQPLKRPEVVAFIGTGLAYAIHFALLPEAMRTALFGRWIPFVASGYQVYGMPLSRIVLENIELWLPGVACLIVLLLRSVRPSIAWRLAGPMAIAALAGTFAMLSQAKGWPYHAIPETAAAGAIVALVIGQSNLSFSGWNATGSGARISKLAASAYVVLTVTLIAFTLLAAFFVVRPKSAQRLAEITSGPIGRAVQRYSNPGDRVLVISTAVGPAYPLLTQLDRKPGSRFLVAFQIPMFYSGVRNDAGGPFPYHPLASRPPEEIRFLAELEQDVRTLRPRLILIDDRPGCQGCAPGFRIYDYLTKMGFVDALAGYRNAGHLEGLALYLPDAASAM